MPAELLQASLLVDQIFQQIEMEMLINIAKLIRDARDVTEEGFVHWQVMKLSQLGMLQKEQWAVLAKYSGMTEEAVKKHVQEVGERSLLQIDQTLPKGYTKLPVSDAIYQRLLIFERNAVDLSNLIQSTMAAQSAQVYKDILYTAQGHVLAGNKTVYQASRDAVSKWAEHGIPAMIDKRGHQWSTEAYVQMVLRSNAQQVGNTIHDDRLNEYDIDLVQTSSHAGSRKSHYEFQGKVYSRSGKSTKYPPLSETGYGDTITGFATGINCAHQIYAYAEGMRISARKYDKEESDRIYEESQKQRYLERRIRNAKKEAAALKAMNAAEEDIKKATDKVLRGQKAMRDFIDSTGRTRMYQREQIFTAKP